MPFTISHPAAVLPILKNKNINSTAAIIGSMAPDFEYFIHFKPYQVYGHTVSGLLFYNLPLVLLVYIIIELLIKQSLIINLPKQLVCRFYSNTVQTFKLSLRSTIIFIYSAVLGMLTHLIWDSFTHSSGVAVKWFGLNQTIEFNMIKIPVYKLLQHGSTLIGFLIIVLYIFNLNEKEYIQRKSKREKNSYWLKISLLSVSFMFIFILIIDTMTLGAYVVSLMNALFSSIFVISLFDKDINIIRKC